MTNPSPKMRIIRTTIQAILALLAAIPAAVGLLDISAETATKAAGAAAALTVVVSAIWNGIEATSKAEG